jgi:hypothetical protein
MSAMSNTGQRANPPPARCTVCAKCGRTAILNLGAVRGQSITGSIQYDSLRSKIRHKYFETDSENRKDVFKQHHRTHFAAGDKTDWYPVKVVPRLTGLLIAICV